MSGVGRMGTGSQGLQACWCDFFLTGKEKGWRKQEIGTCVLPSPCYPLAPQSVILHAPEYSCGFR